MAMFDPALRFSAGAVTMPWALQRLTACLPVCSSDCFFPESYGSGNMWQTHIIFDRRCPARDITNRSSNVPQVHTALNCHFVVLCPKALQSSGPLNRRHAQSDLARVLTHVTYHHPTPAEAAAAVLIRLATAICDHRAYVTRGSTRTHACERERARTKRPMQIVHVTAPLTVHTHDSDNNPAQNFSSSTSHLRSHNHMQNPRPNPQPPHESFFPSLVCTYQP